MKKIDEYEPLINDCLSQFNFHKVRRVMEFLEWTWHGSSTYPTIKELEAEARRTLNSAVEGFVRSKIKTFGYSSCGGFDAYVYESGVSLSFSAEEVDVEE